MNTITKAYLVITGLCVGAVAVGAAPVLTKSHKAIDPVVQSTTEIGTDSTSYAQLPSLLASQDLVRTHLEGRINAQMKSAQNYAPNN